LKRLGEDYSAVLAEHQQILRKAVEERGGREIDNQGEAFSGANNAIRELGGVFGVAVLASVFSSYGGYVSGLTFVDGLVPAVWAGAAVVALGALAAFLIPRRRRSGAAVPGEGELAVATNEPTG
jgi:hypothetical protein